MKSRVKIYTPESLLARGVRQPNGCITIGKPTKSARYWLVASNHKSHHAHRLMWMLLHGDPGDRVVCHRCDNPRCINPEHLFMGTQGDNIRDAVRKGRHHGNRKVNNPAS